jgi:hypothetical protein
MSWQSYVDNNLIGTGQVSQGAIFGLEGVQWATSPELKVIKNSWLYYCWKTDDDKRVNKMTIVLISYTLLFYL